MEIDESIRQHHYYLEEDDKCYFYGEYTARKGFKFSDTNQLILNLKKTVDKHGTSEWRHKEKAIVQAATILGNTIKSDIDITLVPVPPSKNKGDPLYDDRIVRLLHAAVKNWGKKDIRELVLQRESLEASHCANTRPQPDELVLNYLIDKLYVSPFPKNIVIVDDVLTTGCHFKAMQKILLKQFPNVPIFGIFIARRVPESDDLSLLPELS